ncbi:hypothetical protein Tco_0759120 [Tanacetum coccineum]
MSSLRSTGDGMNSKAGSGDDSNSNDVGIGGGKCSDDGAATYSAIRAPMDGDTGGSSADSSVLNASVSPAEGTGSTTSIAEESVGARCSSSSSSSSYSLKGSSSLSLVSSSSSSKGSSSSSPPSAR